MAREAMGRAKRKRRGDSPFPLCPKACCGGRAVGHRNCGGHSHISCAIPKEGHQPRPAGASTAPSSTHRATAECALSCNRWSGATKGGIQRSKGICPSHCTRSRAAEGGPRSTAAVSAAARTTAVRFQMARGHGALPAWRGRRPAGCENPAGGWQNAEPHSLGGTQVPQNCWSWCPLTAAVELSS